MKSTIVFVAVALVVMAVLKIDGAPVEPNGDKATVVTAAEGLREVRSAKIEHQENNDASKVIPEKEADASRVARAPKQEINSEAEEGGSRNVRQAGFHDLHEHELDAEDSEAGKVREVRAPNVGFHDLHEHELDAEDSQVDGVRQVRAPKGGFHDLHEHELDAEESEAEGVREVRAPKVGFHDLHEHELDAKE